MVQERKAAYPAWFNMDTGFLLALLGLLFLFYPGTFLAQQASLMGDHWVQHYPWAFHMAHSLRQGTFPFWTPLLQCGFPLVAESQMGYFYLPNLVFYTLAPFRWAYAFMNPFHFFVAAAGTYVYARRLGIGSLGAFVAAVVFVFGTGYGGAYYNLTSLKTLAWFPWVLFWLEKFIDKRRWRHGFYTAFLISLSLLAGYLQIALLMLVMVGVYLLLRIFFFVSAKRSAAEKGVIVVGLCGIFLGGILLAMPQLVLTFQLSVLSNRMNLSEAYAYVGSLSPVALLTLVFPKLQNILRGNCLYSGIFALYFVIAAFLTKRKELHVTLWLWVVFGVFALLMSLGELSPLYVVFIKVTHFYFFRVPAKFLIFVCFAIAMVAGFGVHTFKEELAQNQPLWGVLNQWYGRLMLGFCGIWGASFFFLTLGKALIVRFGDWMIRNYIYGKVGHSRTFESYRESLTGMIDGARNILSLQDPWQLWAVILIAMSLFGAFMCRRLARPLTFLAFSIAVLLADLYVTAGLDIKKDFDAYANVQKPDAVIQRLLGEKAAGKLGRIYGFRKESETLPLLPAINMLYGIEDIGCYSPLVLRRYYETIGQFGNVDDSNRVVEPSVAYVLERMPLLNALDVSHILAARELVHPDLELLLHDPVGGAYLYRNRGPHARGYFISDNVSFSGWPELKAALMAPGFDPQKVLLLEDAEKVKLGSFRLNKDAMAVKIMRTVQDSDREVWSVETTGPGFFIVTNTAYPGWTAVRDGKSVPLIRAYGLFQAVWIPGPGKHSVRLNFSTYQGRGL